MDWKDIPSLSALRAFEAAARTGSYSAAARELNVTHAAIAQHVRVLEERFGQALMERAGRGVAPTDAGTQLAEDLGRGFSEIAAGVRALDNIRRAGPLCLTTTRTFAENWLMSRMAGFWASHPDIPLAISTDDSVLDLRQAGCDMAIRYYAQGLPGGVDGWFLTNGRKVVVAHPDLASRIDPAEDRSSALQKLPWLVDSTYADVVAWIERCIAPLSELQATEIHGNPLVLSALRAGAGLAAIPMAAVADDIEAGRLQVVMDDMTDDAGYFVISSKGPRSDRVKTFERWLKSQR